MMETVYKKENSEENRFETISDFNGVSIMGER